MKPDKKALIITYYWYPYGGVGNYRISRFVKYLLKSGWDITVLTTKKASGIPEEPDDPIFDRVKVYRSNIIEPVGFLKNKKSSTPQTVNPSVFYQKDLSLKSKLAVWVRLNLMIPDAKFTWKWFAVSLGKKIIEKEKPDIILSTSPPPTTSVIAKKLSSWSGLPWVADFRDPWTNIYYYDERPQGKWAKRKNKKLEASVLKAADHLTLVNNGFFPDHDISERSSVIPNGFDPDHMISTPTKTTKDSSKFVIRYFGSLKINQRPDAFISALKIISQKHPDVASKVHFEFYGSIDPQVQKDIESVSELITSSFTGFIPHDEMMEKVVNSDLLLLAIGRTKNSKFALSTKVFEYMISGNPVLGIGPTDGAASDLVSKTNIGKFFDRTDSDGVAEFIIKMIEAASSGADPLFKAIENEVEAYSFKQLTAHLEEIMLSVQKK